MFTLFLSSLFLVLVSGSPIQRVSSSCNVSIGQDTLDSSEVYQEIYTAIKFAKNMAKNITSNIPLYNEIERNVTDLARLGMVKRPDWLPVLSWNLHEIMTSAKEALKVSLQYFLKIESILDQLITNSNTPRIHLDHFTIIKVENTKILQIVNEMICIEHGTVEYLSDQDRPSMPDIVTNNGLNYMTFFILDNYRNTTNYLDKLFKFLNSELILIDEHCQLKYFQDDNIRDFYINLSIRISFAKQLAKNITSLSNSAQDSQIIELVTLINLNEFDTMEHHRPVTQEEVLKMANRYFQKIAIILDHLLLDQRLSRNTRKDLQSIDNVVKEIMNLIEDTMCREFGSRHRLSSTNRPIPPGITSQTDLDHLTHVIMNNFKNTTIVLDNLFDLFIYDSHLFNFILA